MANIRIWFNSGQPFLDFNGVPVGSNLDDNDHHTWGTFISYDPALRQLVINGSNLPTSGVQLSAMEGEGYGTIIVAHWDAPEPPTPPVPSTGKKCYRSGTNRMKYQVRGR